MTDVTVVGAGVVGTATAACLLRDGHRVMLVDMRAPGEYCSSGNAGIISPGSCVPLGLPGILGKLPGWVMDPLGPLAIRPAYLLKALPWLLRFQAASSMPRVERIADALRALLENAFEAWEPLARWAGVPDLIHRGGYLIVYESEHAFHADALGWKLRRDRGVACEELDAARIRELEPTLSQSLRHGMLLPEQGYVSNPLRLTQALAGQFTREGGAIVEREVLDIETRGDGVGALVTDAGKLPVQTLVICAGVHSNAMSARLGDDVPLESQRGYHVEFAAGAETLARPVMSGEGKFFATPLETGLRVAGSVELAGLDAEPDYRRADALERLARRMLPGPAAGPVIRRWMGHRPCMPDSLPIIGRASRVSNVYYAFGHGHLGLGSAASTAQLIAALVGGRAPPVDVAPYSVTRF